MALEDAAGGSDAEAGQGGAGRGEGGSQGSVSRRWEEAS